MAFRIKALEKEKKMKFYSLIVPTRFLRKLLQILKVHKITEIEIL